jgi:hypothetical protein
VSDLLGLDPVPLLDGLGIPAEDWQETPNERVATLPLPLETDRGPRSLCESGLLQLQSTIFDRFTCEKTPTTDDHC